MSLEYIQEEACSSEILSLYPVSSWIWSKKTAFAQADIVEVPGLGRCLFLDKEIQSSSEDEDIYHECLVHPVMTSVPSGCREKVLVIGGGEGATVREVLKWSDVQKVDWVDIDGELVEACKKHLSWGQEMAYTDSRVSYFAMDIHEFFRTSNTVYDVIIIDLPDPDPEDNPLSSSCLMNRLFWRGVAEHMATGGAWVSHAGPVRRKGLSGAHFIRRALSMADFWSSNTSDYHAVIPSFQDDWGWMMSCRPIFAPFSVPMRFLTNKAYRYIFQWPNRSAF
jgi:spermidine synthase